MPPEQVAEWVALLPQVEEVLALAESGDRGLDDLAQRDPVRAAEIEAFSEQMFVLLGLPLAQRPEPEL